MTAAVDPVESAHPTHNVPIPANVCQSVVVVTAGVSNGRGKHAIIARKTVDRVPANLSASLQMAR